jgi:acetyltransferase
MVPFSASHSGWGALGKFTDVVRLRTGETLIVRFVTLDDADVLQFYFRSLSQQSRYNRLMGAACELPPSELDKTLHVGEHDRFAVIAEMKIDGTQTVVGEARYAYDVESQSSEFGLSIGDSWQRHGIGSALLANLECRSAALGARRFVGETFRNNERMIGLAQKSGYGFLPAPHDWRLVRFEKALPHAAIDIPCENWKQVALANWPSRAALSIVG